MARPGLFQNRKFKRLVARLVIPRPQAVGLLETLWQSSYETGDPVFDDLEEVEAAAEWWGEPAALGQALLSCKLIDRREDGRYEIHDFWDHAPRAVAAKRDREQSRKIVRECVECGEEYQNSDPRSKFCSSACRQKNYRKHSTHGVTDVTERVTEGVTDVTDRYTTPDTRHPTPDTQNTKPSSSRAHVREAKSRANGDEPGKDKADPNGDEDRANGRNRPLGDEAGSTQSPGERRRAQGGTNGDESKRPVNGFDPRDVEEDDRSAGDKMDREIRAFIGRHPMLTYDLKTHGQVRKLVDIAGWPRAQELIERGVRTGARFPAGWAIGVLANEEQSSAARSKGGTGARPPPPARLCSTDERAQATAAAAMAELRSEMEPRS